MPHTIIWIVGECLSVFIKSYTVCLPSRMVPLHTQMFVWLLGRDRWVTTGEKLLLFAILPIMKTSDKMASVEKALSCVWFSWRRRRGCEVFFMHLIVFWHYWKELNGDGEI